MHFDFFIMYEKIKQQFNNLEKQLIDPAINKNQEKLVEIARQHAELKNVVGMIFDLEKIEDNIGQSNEIIKVKIREEFFNDILHHLLC